jgi:D-alanyl-D-alanine carboxypeptidase
MKHQLISAAVAAALLVAAGCGTSTPDASTAATTSPTTTGTAPDRTTIDPGLEKKLQAAVDETRAEGHIPGAIVLVRSPEGVFTLTSGTVGEGATATPTPTDRTRIGSLTKTMTATILLQLVQEGKVALDDPVSKYLDASVLEGLPNTDTVTLLDLVHMTSGIEPYSLSPGFQRDLFADPDRPWKPAEMLSYATEMPAKFAPPGTGWQYSNTNHILLGLVIETVTGQPLSEAFQDRLFGPLGMADTTFPEAAVNTMAANHLQGLTEQGQPDGETGDATNWNPSEAWSAGAVVSTLADLGKWAEALYTGEGILEPATQQLRRDSILFDLSPLTATSGYGIGIGDNNGWWGHEGQIPGYTSSLQHNYDTDTTIIVLTNSDIPLRQKNGEPGPNPAPAIYAAVRGALG